VFGLDFERLLDLKLLYLELKGKEVSLMIAAGDELHRHGCIEIGSRNSRT
jgi:hypothetical protein